MTPIADLTSRRHVEADQALPAGNGQRASHTDAELYPERSSGLTGLR